MNLIACKLCRALLLNDWDEKTHMEWHLEIASRIYPITGGGVIRYDSDENTPFVDNAATEIMGIKVVVDHSLLPGSFGIVTEKEFRNWAKDIAGRRVEGYSPEPEHL